MSFFQKVFFQTRNKYLSRLVSSLRYLWFGLQGMKVGKGTYLPVIGVTWPHQVSIGNNCRLENYLYFKFDGIWKPGPAIVIGDNVFIGNNCEFNIRTGIKIGNDCLIASGSKFIDHDHGVEVGELMRKQHGPEKPVIIGNNVWLGCNVVVLKGVEVGDGSIVAAGAVVNRSVGPNEIWAGVPAKKIGERK